VTHHGVLWLALLDGTSSELPISPEGRTYFSNRYPKGTQKRTYKPSQKPQGASAVWFIRAAALTDERGQRLKPLLSLRGAHVCVYFREPTTGTPLPVSLRGAYWVSLGDARRKHGSRASCWRRFRAWEKDGSWKNVRRTLLSMWGERGSWSEPELRNTPA
jgi:hypothetical protein